MLWGAASGALELRATDNGRFRISGAFPYGVETELAPGRAEVIEARAFASRIEAGEDIHFLAGHDYAKPLASRHAGSLLIYDDGEANALQIAVEIDPATSWAADFLAAHKAGLIRGLSPGFRVPAGGERIERRGNWVLRRIERAELFEISAVTRPAYPAAQIEARAWGIADGGDSKVHPLRRWRA